MVPVRAALSDLGIQPKKSLGQNFLVDDRIARRIVEAAGVSRETLVIEIGAGTGALTRHLAAEARHVVAIELDTRLLPILSQSLEGHETDVSVVHGDVLELDLATLAGEHGGPPVVFLGNLPYYVTSHALRRMLECTTRPTCSVIMVQLEVAQRMIAQPGDMSLLSVSTQYYGRPELLFKVHPAAFYPQPDVDSAVVRVTPHPQPSEVDAETFFALARAGFQQRRKQLRNTLADGLNLSRETTAELLLRAGVDPSRRAETLSIPEWITLCHTYHRHVTPRA